MYEFDILFYEKADGSKPAKEFLTSLCEETRAEILKIAELFGKNGFRLKSRHTKHVEDDIFEFRTKGSPHSAKLMYFFASGKQIVLTNGYESDAKNTPESEIEIAKRYKSDYFSRSETFAGDFYDFLEYQMEISVFKKEYDALEPEFAVIQAIIDARKVSNMTQQELSEKTGIAQSDISKLESGMSNPSIKTLQKLANGMGATLKIEFVHNE